MSKKRERRVSVNRYEDKSRPQARLDFHDFGPITSQEVKKKTIAFVERARRDGLSRVAIITGKGLHSKGRPVVKPQVERTLRELHDDGAVRSWYVEKVGEGGEGAIVVEL